MAILTENSALEYYNRLTLLIEKPDSYNEKIRHIRNILESIFKDLTIDEGRYFTNLHSRAVYIYQRYSLPQNVVNVCNQLRTFCNDIVHNSEARPEEQDYLSCVDHLSKIILFFTDLKAPNLVSKTLSGLTENTLTKRVRSSNREVTEFLRCIFKSVSGLNQIQSGRSYFDIKCVNEDSGENVSIRFWISNTNYSKINLYSYAKNIKPHSLVNFFNLSTDPKNPDLFSSTHSTLIVLEPDFLLEAKEVASCFDNSGVFPENFLLSFILPVTMSIPMFKGSLVNSLFDKILTQPDFDFDQGVQDCFRENAIQSIINIEKIREIRDSLRIEHFPQLKKFAEITKEIPKAIEPTYYSASYGFTGRLDVVMKNENDSNKIDIAELKSSRPPQFDVWLGDKMQCVVYNLLLKSTYGLKRTGLTEIFYSRDNQNGRRNVVNYTTLEADVTHVRNMIVQSVFKICDWDFSDFDRIKPGNYPEGRSFFKDKVVQFSSIYSTLSELEKLYFNHFIAFTLREMRIAMTGGASREDERTSDGFASLWRNDPETKKRRDSLLDGLELVEFDGTTGIVTLRRLNRDISRFRTGEAVLLYSEKYKLNPLSQEILKGSIISFGSEIIEVKLRNRQINLKTLTKQNLFIIELDFIDSNYEEMCKNLFEFVSNSTGKKELLLGLEMPAIEEDLDVNRDDFPLGKKLNDNQFENLKKAILCKDYYLLQGPPGTGKTSTALVNLIQFYLSEKGKNRHTTILAFTNRAVSEISDKLRINGIDFINFSVSSTSAEGITNLTNTLKSDKLKEKIQQTKVFISTAASFSKKIAELSNLVDFDIIIVDEASQLLEPQIVGLLVKFNKMILIGDQNQLPAVSTQDEKTSIIENALLNEIEVKDLRVSLFERLFKICQKNGWTHATGMLDTHFRMHSEIASLVNKYYDDKLKPGREEQNSTILIYEFPQTGDISKLLHSSRLIFVDSGKSNEYKKNDREAVYISALVKFLEQNQPRMVKNGDLGIITPWRSQIQNILLRLGDNVNYENILIDTVERFQGSQRELIILSMASNKPSDILQISPVQNQSKIDKKLNVALSRAQHQLIIFGNPDVLSISSHYKSVLNDIFKKGNYVNAAQAERIFN